MDPMANIVYSQKCVCTRVDYLIFVLPYLIIVSLSNWLFCGHGNVGETRSEHKRTGSWTE